MTPKLSLALPFSCLHQSPECWDCVCATVPAVVGKFNCCRIIIIFLSLSGIILSTRQLHLLFFWANCYSLFCTLLTPRSIFQYQELKCFKLRFSNDTYHFVIGVVWFAFFPESCKSVGPIGVNHGQLSISMQRPGDMQRVLRTGGTWWSQSLVNKIYFSLERMYVCVCSGWV